MGPVYDALSWVFAGNAIYPVQMQHVEPSHLKPGDKVLFAGSVTAKEAIYAAERGAQVRVVDLSKGHAG